MNNDARALLILAHAMRLSTTAPQHDQGFEEWPLCPYGRMDLAKKMLERLTPRTSAICAAIVLLDAARTEDWMIDQPELLTRLYFLAQPSMTSGSLPG